MTERSVKKMNVREKILKTATMVFLDKGYYNARVEDIANKANIAKGTIYLYFRDKKELFLSSIEKEIKGLYLNLKEIMDKEEEPLRKLRKFLSIIYKNFCNKKKYFDSAIRLWPGELGEEIIKIIIPYIRRIIREIEKILKEGREKKIFKEDFSAYHYAVSIMGIIRSAVMAEIFLGKKISFDETFKFIEKILIKEEVNK